MGIRINDEKVEDQKIKKNREVGSIGSSTSIGDYSNKKKHSSSNSESKSTLSLIKLTSVLVNQMNQSENKNNFALEVQIFCSLLPDPDTSGKSDRSKLKDLDNWVDVCLDKYYSEKKCVVFNCKFDDHIRSRIMSFSVGEWLTNEKIEKLKIRFELTSWEKKFFISVLYKCEEVLVWLFKDLCGVHSECLPPQVIKTKSYEAWQTKTY
ncbi:hypothetical protein CIHG_07969 [Coccidioides immitis H538.4]|uniref:Uncharacterized protein n=1 Tax=Coccidioides immitis H538.4 TaxID=396776 RepID=A0A0J8S1D0_COCIT|nr:hypothetical protein CIHG_07969 [Coccidioides immitis H538.4]